MKCKYCGAEVPNDTSFCPNCGKDLSKLKKCVKCGEIIDDDATFCPHCGAEQPVYLEDNPKRKWIWIVIVLVVLIAAGGAFYMYHGQNRPESIAPAADSDSVSAPVDTLSADTTNTTTQDEEDRHSESYIKQRVTEIYNDVIQNIEHDNDLDSYYLTPSYVELIEKADQVQQETGDAILDINHWIMAQDWNNTKLEDVKNINIKDNTHAECVVVISNTFDNDSPIYNNIKLELCFENNDWYIDNFIDPRSKYNERKEILKSFKLMGVK